MYNVPPSLNTVTSQCNEYFTAPDLTTASPNGCYVNGCTSTLIEQQFGRSLLKVCMAHGIRMHHNTYAYFNGTSQAARRTAALRNIRFEQEYFGTHILGATTKAETHRICAENSEDAVTWNVFAQLARKKKLKAILSHLTNQNIQDEPQLFLWGHHIAVFDADLPKMYEPLINARRVFERGIRRFLTEPDVMLLVPGKLLCLIEVKFTSPNTVASDSAVHNGEKPKRMAEVLSRYSVAQLPAKVILPQYAQDPFYTQLYRNLVFAGHMAAQEGIKQWHLTNLVSSTQSVIPPKRNRVGYADPSASIQAVLSDSYRGCFTYKTWETVWQNVLRDDADLNTLSTYLKTKSAHLDRAFDLSV